MKFIARINGLDENEVPIVVESDVFEAIDEMTAAVLAELSFKAKYKNKFTISTIVIQEWKKYKIFNPIFSEDFKPYAVSDERMKDLLDIHWDWY